MMVKLTKFVRPDEAGKWWNGEEYRVVYVDTSHIEYVDVERVGYYDDRGREADITVPRLCMSNGDRLSVMGTLDDVLKTCFGDKFNG